MNLIINFVAFQVGWFSSVIGGAQMVPWAGPAAVVVIIGMHLMRAENPQTELKLIVLCGLIGTAFDSFLVASGWVAYPSGMFSDMFAPYWIIAMWLLFATTLNVSMAWMKSRPALAAVMGLVAGPLTYIAGNKLGGIVFLDQTAALIALGLGWAVLMPVLMWLAQRLEADSKADTGAIKQESAA